MNQRKEIFLRHVDINIQQGPRIRGSEGSGETFEGHSEVTVFEYYFCINQPLESLNPQLLESYLPIIGGITKH